MEHYVDLWTQIQVELQNACIDIDYERSEHSDDNEVLQLVFYEVDHRNQFLETVKYDNYPSGGKWAQYEVDDDDRYYVNIPSEDMRVALEVLRFYNARRNPDYHNCAGYTLIKRKENLIKQRDADLETIQALDRRMSTM